jgi:predicted RNA binding protein YcfA (HicA-like mRNA interferase family)
MRPVSGKRMCKVLEARGWTLARIEGPHYVYVREGPPRNIPVLVHGNRDLKPGMQRAIMRQAGLTDSDL